MAATVLVVLGPGVSSADESAPPVDEVVESVTGGGQAEPAPADQQAAPEQEAPASGASDTSDTSDAGDTNSDGTSTTLATPSSPPPAPSSDDDSPGHETENPAAPDHGGAEVADLDVGGDDVLDVGHNDATVQDDDSTTADSTLLALGGQEVIGAHADSNGQKEEHFGDPLAPLCDESDGALCLRLLYADAEARDNGGTSTSSSRSGAADVCIGGDSTDPAAECTGPVEAGALQSSSEAERNQRTGRTTASSESTTADLCLEEEATGCAVGLEAIHSEGQSDSGGADPDASRGSYFLAGDLGGEEQGRIDDPMAESLPPGCPTGESLLCLFLNQGETYVGDQIAGHAQQALELQLLPGILDINLGLGHTETLVHNDGGEAAPASTQQPNGSADPNALGVGSGGPGAPGAGVGGQVAGISGVLPNTGGLWSGLLAAGLLTTAAGAFFVAFSRRRVVGLT